MVIRLNLFYYKRNTGDYISLHLPCNKTNMKNTIKKERTTQRVSMSRDLNRKLIERAKQERRTISNQIAVAIEKYCETK